MGPNGLLGKVGAIVASVNDYILRGSGGKYALYTLGYAAHCIGDLSMPFHNMTFNDFNKTHHTANDGIVELTGPKDETTDEKVARLAGEIQKRMSKLSPIQLATNINNFYREIAIHTAAIANKASVLGYAMQEANPQRTTSTEEAVYLQLAQSARLLKAVYTTTMVQANPLLSRRSFRNKGLTFFDSQANNRSGGEKGGNRTRAV